MKTPEAYEKDDICKHLDTIKAWYFRPFMAGYGKSGVADIIACIDGWFISIEVKREGKKPTKLQYRRMAEVTLAGGKAFWGTAEKVISEIKRWQDPNGLLPR
jgi:Holliday junction resolvase